MIHLAVSTNTTGLQNFRVAPQGAASNTSGQAVSAAKNAIHSTKVANSSVENAVFSYIKAVRTLGRTSVNTAQIAEALSLPLTDVDRAIANLNKKGVRRLSK